MRKTYLTCMSFDHILIRIKVKVINHIHINMYNAFFMYIIILCSHCTRWKSIFQFQTFIVFMKILLIEMIPKETFQTHKSCLFIKYIKNSAKVSSSLMLSMYHWIFVCLFVQVGINISVYVCWLWKIYRKIKYNKVYGNVCIRIFVYNSGSLFVVQLVLNEEKKELSKLLIIDDVYGLSGHTVSFMSICKDS